MLPAHAETTGEKVYTVFSRTNLTVPVWQTQGGTNKSDGVRACVVVDGATASVTFQTIFRLDDEDTVVKSQSLLAGTLTNGSGTLTPSPNSHVEKESFPATITMDSPTSLTLTVTGGREIIVTLPGVDACVDFIPDAELD